MRLFALYCERPNPKVTLNFVLLLTGSRVHRPCPLLNIVIPSLSLSALIFAVFVPKFGSILSFSYFTLMLDQLFVLSYSCLVILSAGYFFFLF